MPSPYQNLLRPPLSESALRRALLMPGGLWTDLVVRSQTGSTNADVAAAAAAGAAQGLVVVAESQTGGRGRLDRRWSSPPRAGLTVSVLLRPVTVPTGRYGWLPLLAGVALATAMRRIGGVDAVLKWPNDLLIDERKCAGILAEAVPGGVVIGIGLNVSLRAEELPIPAATSLLLAGSACTDRDPLLRALLRALAQEYQRWHDAAGDPVASGLRPAYQRMCATLGRRVTVALPTGAFLSGTATDVDVAGRLMVTDGNGSVTVLAAGDVMHVR